MKEYEGGRLNVPYANGLDGNSPSIKNNPHSLDTDAPTAEEGREPDSKTMTQKESKDLKGNLENSTETTPATRNENDPQKEEQSSQEISERKEESSDFKPQESNGTATHEQGDVTKNGDQQNGDVTKNGDLQNGDVTKNGDLTSHQKGLHPHLNI